MWPPTISKIINMGIVCFDNVILTLFSKIMQNQNWVRTKLGEALCIPCVEKSK
jgi:hypothetical protein